MKYLQFILDNWQTGIGIGAILWELIIRLKPSEKSLSVLTLLFRVINALVPDKSKGGGTHIFVWLLFLLPVITQGQNTTPTKAVYWFNNGVQDTTFLQNTRTNYQNTYGSTGGLYFDKYHNNYKIWAGTCALCPVDSAWVTLQFYAASSFSVSPPLVKTGTNVSIPKATSLVDGYLSSTDWSTFNNKENVLSFANGLTRTSNTVLLGGTLTGTTNLNQSAFDFVLSSSAVDNNVFTFSDNSSRKSYISNDGNSYSFAGNRNPATGSVPDASKSTAQFTITTTSNDGHFDWYSNNANGAGSLSNSMRLSKDGRLTVGSTNIPSYDANANLQIERGNTSFPPLVINEGALTTTPLSNAVENSGTHFYWTSLAGTRYQLDQQGGAPAGSNTQIQFNNAGVFGASANLTWDNANNIITFGTGSTRLFTTNTALGVNLFLGQSAGNTSNTSSSSTGIGLATLSALTSGVDNTALGTIALNAITSGADNTAIGVGSIDIATTANQNTAVGSATLQSLTTGSGNVAIGYNAGQSGATPITTGSDNIFIGRNTAPFNATASNQVIIGTLLSRDNNGEIFLTVTRTTCAGAPSGALANVAGTLTICP